MPCLILTVNVEFVIVAASIPSLKTAVMFVAGEIPLAPLVGTVLVTVGGMASTVQVWLAGVPSVFPAPSVPRTWKVCEPLVKVLYVTGEMHALNVEPSRLHAKVLFASVAVKLKVADVEFVKGDGPEAMLVSGGVLSRLALIEAETAELLDVSTARAVMVTAPSARVAEFQLIL